MSELEKNPEEMKELYDKLFSKGIGMGIMMALHIYRTLNLKKIATLIGKLETTTLNQVNKLRDEEFIEIDSKARGRGKYYKLTDLTKKLLKIRDPEEKSEIEKIKNYSMDDITKNLLKTVSDEKFETNITQVKMITSINNYIENYAPERFSFFTFG